jgi:hypothetical protein
MEKPTGHMPSKGEEMSATTTNLKSREPGREV